MNELKLKTMKTSKMAVGRKGEETARDFLRREGHSIIECNWRSGHLEIDIISIKGNELHIVEVKSRTAPAAARPELNVNYKKRERLTRAAKAYLHSRHRETLPPALEVLFDVLTVVFDGNITRVEYFPGAYIPIYL